MKKITWLNNYNMQIPSNAKTYISFMRTLWDDEIYSKYLIFGKVTNDLYNKETVKLNNLEKVKELRNFFYVEFINFLIGNNLIGTYKLDSEYYSLINSRAEEFDCNTMNTDDVIDMVSDICLDINPTMIEKIFNHWKNPSLKEKFDSDPNYNKAFGDAFIATRLFKDKPDAIVVNLNLFDKDFESIMNDYPVFSMALYHYLTKVANMKNVYLLSVCSVQTDKWIKTFKHYWHYPDEDLPIIYSVNGKPTNSDSSLNLLDILKEYI